jgi:L-fuculose-phosphate aldolase
MIHEVMKRELAEAARALYDGGLVLPGEGNLSLRVPDENAMIITPTMNRYSDLRPEDMAVVTLDGSFDEERSGSRRPSSEFRMHAAVFRQRPKAMAVVHAHPPETVAHAVLGMEIPMIVEEMAILLGGPVPCAAYRRTGTDELVRAVLGSLGSGNAVMLANHGLLTCGRGLTEAVDAVNVVEKLAGIHRRSRELAGSAGLPSIPKADAEVLKGLFRERFSTN